MTFLLFAAQKHHEERKKTAENYALNLKGLNKRRGEVTRDVKKKYKEYNSVCVMPNLARKSSEAAINQLRIDASNVFILPFAFESSQFSVIQP